MSWVNLERTHRCVQESGPMTYEFARTEDLPGLKNLLKLCGLPANDLEMHLDHFLVAREQERLIGCVGLELEGPLLRSLAVLPEFRNRGVAKELCARLLQHAVGQGSREIFLMTETASQFFDKAGF